MNHLAAGIYMAELLLELTNPKIPRWEKEQIEAQARIYAQNYVRKVNESQ